MTPSKRGHLKIDAQQRVSASFKPPRNITTPTDITTFAYKAKKTKKNVINIKLTILTTAEIEN